MRGSGRQSTAINQSKKIRGRDIPRFGQVKRPCRAVYSPCPDDDISVAGREDMKLRLKEATMPFQGDSKDHICRTLITKLTYSPVSL